MLADSLGKCGMLTDSSSAAIRLTLCIIRYKMHRKSYGILAALFNGCYGGGLTLTLTLKLTLTLIRIEGSVMAPLKFADGEASGISFVISFGVGVFGITGLIWLGWWVSRRP